MRYGGAMKLNLKNVLILAGAVTTLQSVPVLAAGWVTNQQGFQVYQNDDGSTVTNSWIKATDNGSTIWYYATNDGSLRMDGWQKIGSYWYYFDGSGVMQTGWVDNENYYCDENGAMKTGWKQLPAPESYSEDEDSRGGSDSYWFYFNASSGEKFRATDGKIKVRSIDGVNYGFDEYGIMQTGWSSTESDGSIGDYLYFAEKTDSKFKMGERLSNTWYAVAGPEDSDNDSLSTGSVEWFYFDSKGKPVAGSAGGNLMKKVGDRRFLFNEKGNPSYGVQKDEDGNYYYCGTSRTDCSVRTGKITITDGDGEKYQAYFDSTGKGVTKIQDGHIYYHGRLQKADPDLGYQKVELNGKTYVVNSSGQVQKNKNNGKDKNGNRFKTDGAGVVTSGEEGLESIELKAPVVTEEE